MLNLFDHWEVGAAALIAAVCLAMGVAVQLGHFRSGVRNTYFNPGVPGYWRTAIFAFIPFGLGFLLLIAGVSISQASAGPGPEAPPDPFGSLLILVGFVCIALFFWWLFRLPEWMKPQWVREYERAQRAGEPVPDMNPPRMSPRAYALNWIGLAALVALWLAVHLPVGPLLIGLGLGLSMLLANRPSRPSSTSGR